MCENQTARRAIWTWLLEYLRKKEIGEEINMIEVYSKIGLEAQDRRNRIFKYRLLLEKCGYIEYSGGEGLIFKKVKAIPKMTKKLASDKAYNKSWKSWFLEEIDPK
jgi:hypothetical protein